MDVAFRCRLQYNSDISKIKKFFQDTVTLKIIAGTPGIALLAITANEDCCYMIRIHSYDIYQLYVNTNKWPKGGIARILPASSFISFIGDKGVNVDLQFCIDADGTELQLSVLTSKSDNVIKSISIPLTIPDSVKEVPLLTYANVVLHVNEFKKLCTSVANTSKEIMIESQDNAIRITYGSSPVTHGVWVEGAPTYTCYVNHTIFAHATNINIGNTKNSLAGIYIQPDSVLSCKVKLGIIDFVLYGKKYVQL